MELIKNIDDGEFGLEGEVYFRIFSKYISLSIEEDHIEYGKSCAEYLDQLTQDIIEKLSVASIDYCNSFLTDIGQPVKLFKKPTDVLKFIAPTGLLVPYPEDESQPVVHLELECEWEPEHGMEWIVRNNKVLYVGAFHDEDPWQDFAIKDSWNYA